MIDQEPFESKRSCLKLLDMVGMVVFLDFVLKHFERSDTKSVGAFLVSSMEPTRSLDRSEANKNSPLLFSIAFAKQALNANSLEAGTLRYM